MNIKTSLLCLLAIPFAVAACEDKPADGADTAKTGDKPEAAPKSGETKPAAEKPAAAAPACDAVVDKIASFNEGSGDAEKKLWGKMCAEMNDAQKTCVMASSDMAGMQKCVADKKLED